MGLRGHEVSSASRRDVSFFIYFVFKNTRQSKKQIKQTAVFFNTIKSKKEKCLSVEAEAKAK